MFQMRIGRRVCVCLRNSQLDAELRHSIRPYQLGWFSCWCEKPEALTPSASTGKA